MKKFKVYYLENDKITGIFIECKSNRDLYNKLRKQVGYIKIIGIDEIKEGE